MKLKETKPYRENVGVVIFNSKKEVLVGNRVDFPKFFQFPQGGIDAGESTLEAAYRELKEETSIEMDTPPIAETSEWLYYDFPADIPPHLKKFQGQKQKWFLFYWEGEPKMLNLSLHQQEFLSLKWMDFIVVVEEVIEFKKSVYEKLYEEFWPFILYAYKK